MVRQLPLVRTEPLGQLVHMHLPETSDLFLEQLTLTHLPSVSLKCLGQTASHPLLVNLKPGSQLVIVHLSSTKV